MCMSYRYEDGQVGDANINTQEARIQREIVRVIGSQSSWMSWFSWLRDWKKKMELTLQWFNVTSLITVAKSQSGCDEETFF